MKAYILIGRTENGWDTVYGTQVKHISIPEDAKEELVTCARNLFQGTTIKCLVWNDLAWYPVPFLVD
jgi:hypothetical protein